MSEEEEKRKEELLKKQLVRMLEPRAYERLMSVKLANPQLYEKAAQYLFQVWTQIRRKITDQELVELLKRLKGPERRTRIEFKRK